MDIQITNLSKSWRTKSVFESISIKVDKNSITSIIGQNGCGKTTLFNIISGQDLNFTGQILFNDIDLKEYRKLLRYKIAYIQDLDNLELNLTGREFCNFIFGMYKNEGVLMNEPQLKLKELSEIFDMDKVLDKSILTYSHGMTKKIQIMAFLSCPFEVLIMDEPFNGLDSESSISLQKILSGLRNKTTVISSHNLEIIQNISNKIVILHNRSIIFAGTNQELLKFSNNKNLSEGWMEILGIENKINKIHELLKTI